MTRVTHEERTQRIAGVLSRNGPSPGAGFPCPYLPGREARQVTLVLRPLAPGVYHSLMDLNFRRLGPVFYRPECTSCRECRMIRVPVAAFRPTRAQRRAWSRNADLDVDVAAPAPTADKLDLYQRYLGARHDGTMDGSRVEFETFLYTSEVQTLEVASRLAGRLLSVAIVDVEPQALSAVYCYFDPDQPARSLGVFNILWMIEECRRRRVPHLYLGYYVGACSKMSYKAGYRPCEVLESDGAWRRL